MVLINFPGTFLALKKGKLLKYDVKNKQITKLHVSVRSQQVVAVYISQSTTLWSEIEKIEATSDYDTHTLYSSAFLKLYTGKAHKKSDRCRGTSHYGLN